MPDMTATPRGAPCWVDLWTSDVESSQHFYTRLFGWEANEPSDAFGGYFMFTLNGRPIAGAMGDMADAHANNTWKPYFASDNLARTLDLATANGATVLFPPAAIADLGQQAVIADPSGAVTGIWQGESFTGFSSIHEAGTPSFVAIDVPDAASEILFYREVFHWDPLEEEADGHHYAGLMDTEHGLPIAGIGDEIENLAPGESPHWSVFWQVDDVDAAAQLVSQLGGTVHSQPAKGGLGRVARVSDPSGATFRMFQPKSRTAD